MQVTDHPAVAMLEQLGGDRFIAMTGAKDFFTSDNPQPRLTMRLPAGLTKKRGTHMEISLLPTDEYMLVFFKHKRQSRKGLNGFLSAGNPPRRDIIGVHRSVQVENLRSCFEDLTGLRTSLS